MLTILLLWVAHSEKRWETAMCEYFKSNSIFITIQIFLERGRSIYASTHSFTDSSFKDLSPVCDIFLALEIQYKP